jgi:hypothetical protein
MTGSNMPLSGVAVLLLAALIAPTSAARHMLQHSPSPAANVPSPAASASKTPTLTPSLLSQPYSSQAFAGNGNFTFLQGYTTNVTGRPGTLQYSLQLVNVTTGSNMSAWHDVPLNLTVAADDSVTFNTLVEIPTGDQAKYETMVSARGTSMMP